MTATKQFGTTEEFNEHVEFALREAANFIKANGRLPKSMGFVLLMFDFGEGGNMFYISDAERDDVLQAMREFIEKHEVNND